MDISNKKWCYKFNLQIKFINTYRLHYIWKKYLSISNFGTNYKKKNKILYIIIKIIKMIKLMNNKIDNIY